MVLDASDVLWWYFKVPYNVQVLDEATYNVIELKCPKHEDYPAGLDIMLLDNLMGQEMKVTN